ncbi:MAG: hypothetical protein R2822_21965 [Spirosomataceae bacterium]
MVEEKLSVLDKFKLLKDLGFDGVELDSPNNLDPKEILEARDKTGLELPALSIRCIGNLLDRRRPQGA